MANLIRYESNNGVELVINTQTGESFATQAGYVRMSGKAKMTISDRIKASTKVEFKSAEINTGYGIKRVRLIKQGSLKRADLIDALAKFSNI